MEGKKVTEFRIDIDWRPFEEMDPLLGRTSADIGIRVGDQFLTQNFDEWIGAIRDRAYVSAYPLAIWLVSSWWRIHHEVLPARSDKIPPVCWRMSHEIAAANFGYVWPFMVFWSDRNAMNIRAEPFPVWASGHSLRYLTGLSEPASVRMEDFSDACRRFIDQVVERLKAENLRDSDLEYLWSLVLDDMNEPNERQIRRIEAQFGFNPEESPDTLLEALIAIEDEKGEDVLAELAAVGFGLKEDCAVSIRELFELPGFEARPELPQLPDRGVLGEPWRQAKEDASVLRRNIDAGSGVVADELLADLLGLRRETIEADAHAARRPAAVLGLIDEHRVKVVPRKRHPAAQRFEMARLVGGYADAIARDGNSWLASTDSTTARQKYQRAFAAEFLCPIEALMEFLDGDVCTGTIEDAAAEFEVSERVVEAQLMNNHSLPRLKPDYYWPILQMADSGAADS